MPQDQTASNISSTSGTTMSPLATTCKQKIKCCHPSSSSHLAVYAGICVFLDGSGQGSWILPLLHRIGHGHWSLEKQGHRELQEMNSPVNKQPADPQSRNTLYLSLAHSFSPGPCTPTQAPLNHSSDRFSGGGDRAWTALRGFNHANTTALAGLEIGNNM